MGQNTTIEWTGSTWSPLRARNKETGAVGWHCEKPSTGCKHCYAEAINKRLGTGLDFTVPNRDKVEIFLDEKMALNPTRWKKPRPIFPCSMTDLFGEFHTDEMIYSLLAVMSQSPDHTFQVLTKRAERAAELLADPDLGPHVDEAATRFGWCHSSFRTSNIQVGFSAEDQPNFDRRWAALKPLAADGWFVWTSIEPQIGPIRGTGDSLLAWAVIGGESGPGARSFDVQWPLDIIAERRAVNLPTFLKQLGAKPVQKLPGDIAPQSLFPPLLDKKGGDMNEWSPELRVREFPEVRL